MNDFRDLKSIAEACQQHQPLRFMRSHGALYIRNDNGIVFDVHQNRSFPEFMAQNKDYADLVLAANPAKVLALIAENERVKARLCVCRDCGGQGEVYSGHSSYQGHNQPPEPDMDVCGTCGGDGVLGSLEDFEALAVERDQLKAENDLLKSDNREMLKFKEHMVELRETHGFDSWAAALVEVDRLRAENEALREEVALDDKLIADRDRLLNMFECPVHGQCIPYAMEQVETLRKALTACADSLHAEMLQKFGGQLPEDMHPVTRREYDRDMAEVSGYRAAMGKGEQS